MTRIEAIRQRAERRTSPYGDIEAQEDMDALLTLWDTRETALRALVEQLDEYDRIDGCSPQNPWCYDPTYSNADHYAGHRAAKREQIDALREALSRLLEQEP